MAKHDENDDGASTMRRDLSVAKIIVYAVLSRSGSGRRTIMLGRVHNRQAPTYRCLL